ncbi:SPT3 Dosage dependent suppressor of Ty-induced promoter mutations-like protein [Phlyctochytrium planicorne]|nr:SPT3 Dosage dependent suppressor of Ty-induced promoter mutations-like protein [Phlyctochytrium planicorne]
MYPHKTSPPSDDDSAYSSMHDDAESFVAAAMRTSQSPLTSPSPQFFPLGMPTPSATKSSMPQSPPQQVLQQHSQSQGSFSSGSASVPLASMPQHPTLFAASQSNHFMASPISEKPGSSSKDPVQSIKAMLDASIGYAGQNLQIRVLGVPQQNAKSRVETQIKLCLQLVTAKGEKVPHWSYLRLPELLTTRDRQRRGKNADDLANLPSKDVLDLQAMVVCASDPSKLVNPCSGCIQREMKRSKKKDAKPDGDFVFKLENEDDLMEQERKKILLFNCSSLVDFSSGDTILPSRITCYCRHHSEKLGFCIYFIARDHNGNVISTGISPPILITDDHKSSKVKGTLKRPRTDEMDEPMITDTASSDALPGKKLFLPGNAFPPMDSMRIPEPSPESFLNLSPPPFKRAYVQPSEDDDFTTTLANTLLASLESGNPTPTPSLLPTPTIGRIIPSEGPMHGGVEITILGSGFHENLTVQFGDVVAGKVQCWGNSTIICLLPPSAIPGPVPVTFREHPEMAFLHDHAVFTYKDESERALMELALQVVGLRMTGKLEDARNVAMRIVTDTAQEGGGSESQNGAEGTTRRRDAGSYAIGHTVSRLLAHSTSTSSRSGTSRNTLELLILDAMISISDLSTPETFALCIDTPHKRTRLTLLHLACQAGMTTLAKYLMSSGAEVDARDANGYTPLHFAVMNGERSVVMELLETGASPFLTSSGGVSALGLAKRRGYPAIYEAVKEFVIDPLWDDGEDEEFFDSEEEESEDEEVEEVEEEVDVVELPEATSEQVEEAVPLPAEAIYEAAVVEPVVPHADAETKHPQHIEDQLASLIAEAAATLPEKLPLPSEKSLPAIPPLPLGATDKLKETPSSLAWLTFPTFTTPQFAPLIALPVQLPALPTIPQLPKLAMPNIGLYLPVSIPGYWTGSWFGADPVAEAVAEAKKLILEGDAARKAGAANPELDPPPPYTPPAVVPSAASSPVTARAHHHVPAPVAHSLPSVPSIVPPPPEPKDTDAMDELCDCGAAFEGRVEHEVDCRRTLMMDGLKEGTVTRRLVATNEDMDNLVSKFVTMHAVFLQHVQELLGALKERISHGNAIFWENVRGG